MASRFPDRTRLKALYELHCDPRLAEAILTLDDRLGTIHPHNQADDAESILVKRYYLKDEAGVVFEDRRLLFCRVAVGALAHTFFVEEADVDVETTYERAARYFDAMWSGRFLPNSPTLMNACTREGQLSACFVVPVDDSIDGIYGGVGSVAKIHKSGGGTGMDFSQLRQKDAAVRTTGGVASGPVSFMEVYDTGTKVIAQGGKRRGANMGMLRVDHPDIHEFITCKDFDLELLAKIQEVLPDFQPPLSNFNLSVALTDEFMDARDGQGEDFETAEASDGYLYPLRDPRTGEIIGYEDARAVWELLVKHAHATGDPGIVFIDRINATQPFDVREHPEHTIRATNPCGEQPLEAWEACNLGSINLACYVAGDTFDWKGLTEITQLAVDFLDNVIDSSVFPLPQIAEKVRANRKIGLGVMGWADALIDMKIRYGSNESIELARRVMRHINDRAHDYSRVLASLYGRFPSFEESKYAVEQRNATLTTIAPTGTLSMIAGVSSGVEPVFGMAYTKTVMDGAQFQYVHPALARHFSDEADRGSWWNEMLATGRVPADILDVWPYYVTTFEVSPDEHVLMQAAFQETVDNAVSKTVNLPNDATVEDVSRVYEIAYRSGCKGITIYRDGSKAGQVLTTGTVEGTPEPVEAEADFALMATQCDTCPLTQPAAPMPRPEIMMGMSPRIETPCGTMYVTLNVDDDGALREVFCAIGKSGVCGTVMANSASRLISTSLRAGLSIDTIIKQLAGQSCSSKVGFGPNKVVSCMDALALTLRQFQDGTLHQKLGIGPEHDEPMFPDGPGAALATEAIEPVPHAYSAGPGACPECGAGLEHEGGCAVCRACGFSKCA